MAGAPKSLISQELMFGLGFTGVTISFFFIIFRLSVRWRIFGRFFWDDACVFLAWAVLLAIGTAWWCLRDGLLMGRYLQQGLAPPTQHNIDVALQGVQLFVASEVTFSISLWLIKLSVLIFFRRLSTRQKCQRMWWWFVTMSTVLSFCALTAATPFQCATRDIAYLLKTCYSARMFHYKTVFFYCQLAADIVTDILIISIPSVMLWNVQMPRKQKLALVALLSMSIVVILCAIVRIAVNTRHQQALTDKSWLAFWGLIELVIALIVACLSSFRQLFKSSGNRSSDNPRPTQTKRGAMKRFSFAPSVKSRCPTQRDMFERYPHSYTTMPHSEYDAEACTEGESKQVCASKEVDSRDHSIPFMMESQIYLLQRPAPVSHQGRMVLPESEFQRSWLMSSSEEALRSSLSTPRSIR